MALLSSLQGKDSHFGHISCLVSAEEQEAYHGDNPRKAGDYKPYKVGRPKVGYPRVWQFLSVYRDGVVETINSSDCDPQAFIE